MSEIIKKTKEEKQVEQAAKEIVKEATKEVIEKKTKEEIEKANKAAYSKQNIVKEEQFSKTYIGESSEKKKVYRERKYANGVIKRELVGIIKNGKTLFDHGIDKKELNK
jgi:hypothetical protein